MKQEYDDRNVQILGISFDTVEENRAFAEKFHFPFPLLCDTSRSIGMAYGACDSPQASSAKRITYVIDTEGIISHVYGKVDAAAHPAQLISEIGQ